MSLSELRVRESEVTANFDDQAPRSGLGVPGTVALLNSATHASLRLTIAPNPTDHDLADQIARAAGWSIQRDPDGSYVLVRPGAAPSRLRFADASAVPYIELTRHDIYTDAWDALAGLVRMMGAKPLPRYHNRLTGTFRKGHLAGQVKSLFRDLKSYGYEQIATKLIEFADYVRLAPDPEPQVARFRSHMAEGLPPHDSRTFESGAVSMLYFKVWAILQIVDSEGKPDIPDPS